MVGQWCVFGSQKLRTAKWCRSISAPRTGVLQIQTLVRDGCTEAAAPDDSSGPRRRLLRTTGVPSAGCTPRPRSGVLSTWQNHLTCGLLGSWTGSSFNRSFHHRILGHERPGWCCGTTSGTTQHHPTGRCATPICGPACMRPIFSRHAADMQPTYSLHTALRTYRLSLVTGSE